MIIGLALFSFILLGHSHEGSEERVTSDKTKIETVDVVKLADAEVIK
jgi:hypothetical protein